MELETNIENGVLYASFKGLFTLEESKKKYLCE